MKKYLCFLGIIFSVNCCAEQLVNYTYNHSDYPGTESKEAVEKSVNNGFMYWQDCMENTSRYFQNQSNNFQVVWTDMKNNEWGAANYEVKNNQTISFKIELNKNKNMSLKQIEKVISHEVGHTLHMKHEIDKDSTMFYTSTNFNETMNKEKDNYSCKNLTKY